MYNPKHFEQPCLESIHDLMNAYPFATLVTLGADGLCADHIPLELQRETQPNGVLQGHVSRANPLWQIAKDTEVLSIFQGPHSYITPSWYPSKHATGKAVPTWNYAVVHAHGVLRVVEDPLWLRAHVERLTKRHEAAFDAPWTVSDAPDDFIEKLLHGIVGIEIVVSKLVGKWKLSQNRSDADKTGVIAGLNDIGATEIAEIIEQTKAVS